MAASTGVMMRRGPCPLSPPRFPPRRTRSAGAGPAAAVWRLALGSASRLAGAAGPPAGPGSAARRPTSPAVTRRRATPPSPPPPSPPPAATAAATARRRPPSGLGRARGRRRGLALVAGSDRRRALRALVVAFALVGQLVLGGGPGRPRPAPASRAGLVFHGIHRAWALLVTGGRRRRLREPRSPPTPPRGPRPTARRGQALRSRCRRWFRHGLGRRSGRRTAGRPLVAAPARAPAASAASAALARWRASLRAWPLVSLRPRSSRAWPVRRRRAPRP